MILLNLIVWLVTSWLVAIAYSAQCEDSGEPADTLEKVGTIAFLTAVGTAVSTWACHPFSFALMLVAISCAILASYDVKGQWTPLVITTSGYLLWSVAKTYWDTTGVTAWSLLWLVPIACTVMALIAVSIFDKEVEEEMEEAALSAHESKRRRWTIGLVGVAIASAIVAWLIGGSSTSQSTLTAEVGEPVDLSALTVTPFEISDQDLIDYLEDLGFADGLVPFNADSMPVNNNDRTSAALNAGLYDSVISDAVEWPLTATTDEGKFLTVKGYIVSNPVYGRMVALGLSDLSLGSATIGELNPWIEEFLSDYAAAFAATEVGRRGTEIWLTSSNGVIYVTEEYLRYAVALCRILDCFEVNGVVELKSAKNYSLGAYAEAYSVRVAEADYQESWSSLIMTYKAKNGTIVLKVGFNVFDARFEVFTTTVKTTTAPSKTTTTTSTPEPVPVAETEAETEAEVLTPEPVEETMVPTPNLTPAKNGTYSGGGSSSSSSKKKVKDTTDDPVSTTNKSGVSNAEVGGGENTDTSGAGTYQEDISGSDTQGGSSTSVEDSQYQPEGPGGSSSSGSAGVIFSTGGKYSVGGGSNISSGSSSSESSKSDSSSGSSVGESADSTPNKVDSNPVDNSVTEYSGADKGDSHDTAADASAVAGDGINDEADGGEMAMPD